tara:strand:- start:13237 stop:14403 length:1167 start_codon:yes stop_codon:yes gene_type:complete
MMKESTETDKRLRVLIMGDLPLCKFDGLSRFSEGSGNSTWLESLFPFFGKDSKIDVHWLVLSKSAQKYTSFDYSNQTIHVLPRWKKLISMLTRYYSEIRQIKKVVNQIDPDIIHSWGSEDVYTLATAGINKPKLFTLQGCLNDYLAKLGGSFLFRLQTSFEIPSVKCFRFGTAETPMAEEQLLSLNPKLKTTIIDYGVHTRFHDTVWNPSQKPTLFYAGSICQRKGVRDMIDAFSKMKSADVELRIAGEGELKQELMENSPTGVRWLGMLSNEQVRAELASCWAFIMPTYADTGPTAVKEARVVGCPVITTQQAGAKCYIECGKNGFVIESGDTEALVDSMKQVCRSKELTVQMGNYNRKAIKEELHPANTVDKFFRLYSEIITIYKH